MSIIVVQIIKKLNLDNPKYLFVISYKWALRLTMERVSECFKINLIYFVGIRTLCVCVWGGGVSILALGPGLIPSGEVWRLYLLIQICTYVSGGLFISVFRREMEECFIVLSRKVSGIFCGHSHVRARRGHITRTDTIHGTYWHVAVRDFGSWQSRVLRHKLYFRKENHLTCIPQSHLFVLSVEGCCCT